MRVCVCLFWRLFFIFKQALITAYLRVPEAEVVTPKKQKQVIVRVIRPRCVGKVSKFLL